MVEAFNDEKISIIPSDIHVQLVLAALPVNLRWSRFSEERDILFEEEEISKKNKKKELKEEMLIRKNKSNRNSFIPKQKFNKRR